ncbi:MAG TPA: serine/threonine-protein kinase, partial [Minicystis sp.]|nr:serine/threonine-protein kinase [Minicystis sp.]
MGDATDTDLTPGTMVGGYRVEYRLGAGGVGTVYAGEEPTIKKRVAIKVLKRAFADDDASTERFEREARAANAVKHPGIVDVFAFGRLVDGRPYLVMSLLEGRSLRDEIAARGRLPALEAWAVAREIALALAAAHARGVVHRDLKPDNVFLERVGEGPARPRLLDFGIAKVEVDDDGEALKKLTLTGTPIGTPKYMAPEQWWAHGVTARTDQYCFGAMLFEMLTGEPPFSARQFMELAHQHMHEAPPSLATRGIPAPDAVERLVSRALEKKPEARFASMTELVEAGDRAFGGGAAAAAPRSEAEAIDPMAATAIASAPETTAPSPGAARRAATPAPVAKGALRRYLALHAIVVTGLAFAIVGVGYAGPRAHDVVAWIHIGGGAQYAAIVLFAVAALGLAVIARRRARGGG